ncbi:uncharacterized protein LOC116847337 isoform X2 [Odontomachus brunneus]|uniref:uncharacterized protein LOC116847337 isoform X2 n=1 Tax=Odontomachus brunneus TaxID=486640 RepID=UPI0013F20457|nr:uncharacterized protein LOC116847337 isoform X2 [Odontomachus brunneus]
MWLSSILVCSLIFLTSSSKCPEPKKPHRTSCTIFYSCVNLPDGGYVWVPSRCTDGLVFQPYLRVCVVPGDIWTCDTLSTDSSLVTKRHQAESIDETESSYLGYTQDPAEFSETIDSSYVIEDDTSNLTTETETPYPLIEFEEHKTTTTSYDDRGVRNVSYHKEEKYLYEYINNRRRSSSASTERYKDIVNEHYKLLHELMSRLHVYKELSAAISPGSTSNITTVNPTGTIAVLATHDRKQNVSLDYLVQSFMVAGNESHKPSSETTESCETQTENVTIAPTKNSLELLVDGLDADNNIIRITDGFGNERYLTVDRYKVLARRLNPRSVSVLTCTKNVRLANRTDCNKYYMCDPKTAIIVEYSCPLHTAFNVNSRICDTESAKTCRDNERATDGTTILFEQKLDEERGDSVESSHSEDSTQKKKEEKLCREVASECARRDGCVLHRDERETDDLLAFIP